MPSAQIIRVTDDRADLWGFQPVAAYAAEKLPDGTIVLTPATVEQLALAAYVDAVEENEDFAPGVTIRPIFGDPALGNLTYGEAISSEAIYGDPSAEAPRTRRFPWSRR